MKKEIEVKLQIDTNQLDFLQQWLNDNATFIDEIEHKEVYLNNPKDSFFFVSTDGYKDALKYLRVRFTPKGDSLCYKLFVFDKVLGKTLNDGEIDVDISDGESTLQLLELLGYIDKTFIEKKRITYIYKDFEIVIDDVKGVGVFVEIELKKDLDDVKYGLGFIYDLLRQIGIFKFKIQNRGYVSMAWNPKFNFGETIELT